MGMDVIDSFVDGYGSDRDEYEKIRDALKKTIDKMLNDAGIMAITSSRTKDPDRLREKLEKRNEEKKYKVEQDIINDIPDLVGARIALYFPDDASKIPALLPTYFDIKKIKIFPDEQRKYKEYERRFSGYAATHYRVQLKSSPAKLNPVVEIQVASLLMHAWSEVEHDLAYKAKKGDVSYEEYEALDEINGLVIAGEISLQRLQRLTQARILEGKKSFSSHYQLADFLYEKSKEKMREEDVVLGDVESLYKLYEETKRLSIKKIENDLARIDFFSNAPIAQQLIDLHTDTKLHESEFVIANRVNKAIYNVPVDDASLGAFLKVWIQLEKQLDRIIRQRGLDTKRPGERYAFIRNSGIFSGSLQGKYDHLRRVRNEIVHGMSIPTSEEFKQYTREINELISYLSVFPDH